MSTRKPESDPTAASRPESSRPDPNSAPAPDSPAAAEPTVDAAATEAPVPVGPESPAEQTPPAAESGFSASELREISAAINEAFPLVSDTTELVLVDVDPHRVHAHWNVQPADLNAARRDLGPAGAQAELVLRFHDLTVADGEGVPVHAPLELEVDGLQNDWYIDLWSDARSYLAELGLRDPDGRFVPLVQSNPVQTPRAAEAAEESLVAPTVVAKLAEQADVVEASSPAPSAAEGGPAPPADRPAAPAAASPVQDVDRTLVGPADQVLEAEFPHLGGGEPAPPAAKGAILVPAAHAPAAAAPVVPDWVPSVEAGPGASEGGSASFASAGAGAAALEGGSASFVTTGPTAESATAGIADVEDRSLAPGPAADLAPEFPNVDGASAAPAGAGERPRTEVGLGEPGPAVAGPGHAPPPDLASQGMDSGGVAPVPGSLLSYSSSTLAHPAVDLELHVELHVYGRARPGADLNLFGRRVALRPDGSFSFRRPLRNGAIVVPVLFADEGGPLEDGEA